MKIIIDLDGTICSEEKFEDRAKAKVIKGARRTIDILKKKGNKITIYSARPWSQYEMTKKWLKKNKIKFDYLLLGKPIGDYWIDDRSLNFKNWEKIDKFFKKK
tara:strand:- start:110 stop:418 length:309 start_codon:yes stop_codon:yes gene_type:complete